jgi:hypothetical protein
MTVMAYDEMYIWLIKKDFGMHQPTLIMSAHPVRDTPSEELSSGRNTPNDPINEKAGSEISHSSTLASRPNAYPTKRGPVTDAVVNFFSLRRKHHDTELLDDIATQPSVYDTEQAEHYQPRDDWENIEAFDPTFRWTWREEAKALRKVDWKVLTWVCVMFFALGEPCFGSLPCQQLLSCARYRSKQHQGRYRR